MASCFITLKRGRKKFLGQDWLAKFGTREVFHKGSIVGRLVLASIDKLLFIKIILFHFL